MEVHGRTERKESHSKLPRYRKRTKRSVCCAGATGLAVAALLILLLFVSVGYIDPATGGYNVIFSPHSSLSPYLRSGAAA
jgi:hypothetical protein